MKKKICYTDAVFYVLNAVRRGVPLDMAQNDAANIYGNTYEEYMQIWNFFNTLVW